MYKDIFYAVFAKNCIKLTTIYYLNYLFCFIYYFIYLKGNY